MFDGPVTVRPPENNTFDRSKPVFVFECPHASDVFPEGYPKPDDLDEREEHEKWDPGAAKLLKALQQRFPNAYFIESKTSRLLADHNREKGYCFESVNYSEADQRRILADIHQPYIITVHGVINEILANGQYPIVCNVHTYNPKLVVNGVLEERKLCSVGGEPDSVLVQVFHEHLSAQLSKPDAVETLAALGLSEDRLLHDINVPFNFAPMENGKPNPLLIKNMATRYALGDDHLWVHAEFLNSHADEPIVQKIAVAAYDATLHDSRITAEWTKRRDRYFDVAPREIARPVALGPMLRPAGLVL